MVNPSVDPPQSALDRADQRAAAFLKNFFPDGKVPKWASDLVAQRRAQAAAPYRFGLPPQKLRNLHNFWEAYVEGSDDGVVYDFYLGDDGTPLHKLHEEPFCDVRPVASFDDWDAVAFRPWCASWEEADKWVATQQKQG